MEVQLVTALPQHAAILKNLMQFYLYDFSEFVLLDVEEDGLFAAYPHLDDYWKDENRFPYMIQKDKSRVGFVLVRFIETAHRSYFSIAEFFVLRKYRREGIGKYIAGQVFDRHKGPWEVYQKEGNQPAQLFWKEVIGEYTKGQFTERFETGRRIQNFVA